MEKPKLLIVSENPFGKSSWSNQAFNLLNSILLDSRVELYYLCLDIGLPFQKQSIDYTSLPFKYPHAIFFFLHFCVG